MGKITTHYGNFSIKTKLLVNMSVVMIMTMGLVGYIFYSSTYTQTIYLLQKQALVIAQAANILVNGDHFERISISLDKEDEYYQKTLRKFKKLNEEVGQGMLYAYIPHDEESYTYVIDGSETVDIGFKQRKQDFSKEADQALKDGQSYICEPYYIETFDKHYISAFVPILNSQKQVVGVIEYDYEESEFINKFNHMKGMVIIVAILIILLILGINYLTVARIFKPVKRLIRSIEGIAEGDLTVKLDVDRRDEIGKINSAINKTICKIHSIIGEIKQNSEKITIASKSIMVSARDTSEVCEEMAISMDEISGVLHEKLDRSKEMQIRVDKMDKETKNIEEVISKISEDIIALNGRMNITAEDYERLHHYIKVVKTYTKEMDREIGHMNNNLKAIEYASEAMDLRAMSLLAVTQEQAATSDEFKEMAELLRQQAKELDKSISKFKI